MVLMRCQEAVRHAKRRIKAREELVDRLHGLDGLASASASNNAGNAGNAGTAGKAGNN
jgi:hypothetical protein